MDREMSWETAVRNKSDIVASGRKHDMLEIDFEPVSEKQIDIWCFSPRASFIDKGYSSLYNQSQLCLLTMVTSL